MWAYLSSWWRWFKGAFIDPEGFDEEVSTDPRPVGKRYPTYQTPMVGESHVVFAAPKEDLPSDFDKMFPKEL